MFGAFAAVGYGSWLSKRLRIDTNWGERGLLGLFCLALIALILHFFFALSHAWIRVPVLALGCILCAIEIRKPTREQLILAVASVGIVVFALLQPMNFETSYDNGLYHLQAVRWNLDSPLTPGLANLHGRLGFNTTLFLLVALIDVQSSLWLVNLLTTVFVLIAFADRIVRPRSVASTSYATAAIVAFLAFPARVNWLGVLDADRMISVLVAYAVLLLIEARDPALLLLIAALAASVKLFAAPLLVAALWQQQQHRVWKHRAGALAFSMLALFGLRGVMLSGCAAYPAGFTCLTSLPWAVLPIQARWDDLCVRAWGRNAGDPDFIRVLASWDWFPRWRELFVQDPQVQFAMAGIVFGLLFAIITRRADKAFRQAAIVLFAALGFWFWASPGVRYGQCFIISAGILGFAVMQPTRWISPVALALALAWAGWNYTPASIQITEVEAYQIEPATGVGVWMPKRPEQCWNHPVPCAANFEQSEITRIHWRIPVPFRKDNPAPKDFEVIPPYRLNPLKE